MANKAVSKQETKPSVSDFQFLHDPKDKTAKLGVGSFASVKLAKSIKTQKLHAMKIISMHPSRITASDLHNMKTEISIHRTLNHPNIIKFYNYFQSQHDLYLVLEFAENGNLYSYLHKKKSLRQEEIFRFFYQTCLAIQYMHQNNTLHRDIKPENLLLDKDFNIKLCDFGWSARQIREKRVTFCGTYEYMAPEIIHKKSYDYRVDIWSLGVLLYELIHKEAPYKGRSMAEITKSLAKADITFSPNTHPDAKDLIQKILKSNPDERLTIEKILSHPWIKSHLPESQTEESIIDLKEINSNIQGEKVKTGSDQKAISFIEAPIYRDEQLQKELRERNPNRIEAPAENLNKQRVISEKSLKDKPASSIPAAPFNKLFINLEENGGEDSDRNKVFENNLASPLLKIKGKSFINQISVPQTTTNKLRMEISSLFSSRTPSHNSSQNSYNPMNLTCRNQSDQTSNFLNYSSRFDLRIGQSQKSGPLYLSGQQTYRVNGQENIQQTIPLQNPEIFKSSALENKLGDMYSKMKTNQFDINTDFVRNKENQGIIKEQRMINWGL